MFSAASGFDEDPRQFAISLARYKWVARMLTGKSHVLEVGCADGWKSRIVRQAVGRLTAIDPNPELIAAATENASPRWPIEFRCQSALEPLPAADAVYSLDVLEHIAPHETGAFLKSLRAAAPLAIIGMPSLESQAYASPNSRAEHVNCMSAPDLRRHLARHYREVFIFSGHDEIIATSHLGMAHYLMALAIA